jgi:hypothetical protein
MELEKCLYSESKWFSIASLNGNQITFRTECDPTCKTCKQWRTSIIQCRNMGMVGLKVSSGPMPEIKETGFYVDLYFDSACRGAKVARYYFSQELCQGMGGVSRKYLFNEELKKAEVSTYSSGNCGGSARENLELPLGVCSKYVGNYYGIVLKK